MSHNPAGENGRTTQPLSAMLDNLEREEAYTVVEVLRKEQDVCIEKVSKDGCFYVRKQYLKRPGLTNEFDLLSRLNHPCLPVIYEAYELVDKLVIIEELIQGVSLTQYVAERHPLSAEAGIDLILELCSVADFLHAQLPPVIHRDIKPDNIICTDSGSLKLIDFNIARRYSPQKERDTVFLGTIGYAPPEQYGFGQTDMRSDIYSIGMTLLFLFTGCEPDPNHIPWDRLPPGIAQIVCTSTQFAPGARYQSVRQMTWELNNLKRALLPAQPGNEKDWRTARLERIQKKKKALLQLLLLPFHFIALIATVDFLFIEPFHLTPGFGLQDTIVSVLEYLSLPLVVLLPMYLLGLNMFYLTDRIPFLKTNKVLKLALLFVLLVLLELLLVRMLHLFHTAEFLSVVSS